MDRSTGMVRLTKRLGGLAYGGDYNPEQWPEAIWAEDVELMGRAGVNLVTVGVFAWALLEPEPGRFEFGWLDRVLDLLHDHGIAVDLASGTASPPPWFTTAHAEAALVDADGIRRHHGARQAYCPSSVAFREAAMRLTRAVAERYGSHPSLVLWHVSNEYACHNFHCYCDASAAAFRVWLQRRYGGLAELNTAWGTAFWSQQYGAWEQILPPRTVSYRSFANPTQQLDWWRFSSGEHLRLFEAEAEILRAAGDVPVTTNFMSFFKPLDYWAWAPRVDVVSNDDYLLGADPVPEQRLAMSADLMRSLADGGPWLLMEHSTSAVNWQPRNLAKAPGQLRRNSMQHLARGADGALFFQWRASSAGAEKFHSALVPHAGTDSKIWREVEQFGAELKLLAALAGSSVETPQVAIVLDWEAWWAAELDSHPSADLSVLAQLRRWYAQFWDRGITVDFVRAGGDLGRYRLVVVPAVYLVTDSDAATIAASVARGGAVIVTYFSGLVDENDHVRLGGYPGAFRDLLGIRMEEFAPLLPDDRVPLSDGTTATGWSEFGAATTAQVLASYGGGPAAGSPAVTVNSYGQGRAWYVGTDLDDPALDRLVDAVLAERGIRPVVGGLPRGVEVVRRRSGTQSWLVVINHTGSDADVAADGYDLLGRRPVTGSTTVPAGGLAVVEERVDGIG